MKYRDFYRLHSLNSGDIRKRRKSYRRDTERKCRKQWREFTAFFFTIEEIIE